MKILSFIQNTLALFADFVSEGFLPIACKPKSLSRTRPGEPT